MNKDLEEKFIASMYAFLEMCAKDAYIGEDMPPAPECVRGSKKVSVEQFYALIF